MCGINIIYRSDQTVPQNNRLLHMNRALRHRGPDDEGVYLDDGIGMGHTRLSVVDIESGKQPMTSSNGQLTIVYNGELYNYQELRKILILHGFVFKTDSDTEVLLYLYQLHGAECVTHMRGMFSFAIHEKQTGRLFLARDRLGIKPLFYHWNREVLVAASEIKAIFASGHVEPQLNHDSIKNYFTYQFSISPNTSFESVYELPPGHHMTIIPGGTPEIVQYWDLEFPCDDEYESLDENYWLDQFKTTMEDAVSSHTIGDVPVGAYLSGGIDSCTIAQLLTSSYSEAVQTFSIGFSDPDYDESSIFKQIADYLDVKNKQLHFSNDAEHDFFEILSECLYHLEQPQRMSVDIPHFLLSKLVRDKDHKVVCTGDGADEILAGYDCFRQDSMRTNSNGFFKQLFRKKTYLNKYTQYFSEDHMQMLLQLHSHKRQQDTISKFGFYPAWYDYWQITGSHIDDLFIDTADSNGKHTSQIDPLVEQMQAKIKNRHPVNQSLYFETKTRLPGWILWKSDRLSMAHGIEARVPFMDHSLVELAAKIPPQLKLNGMNEKYILKRMMSDRLPETPHEFKKRGFYTPIRQWFFTPDKREYISEYFSPAAINKSGIFNPVAVNSLYEKLTNIPEPSDMNSCYQCMRLEWVLMSVLSVQMLHRLFVEKKSPCFEFDIEQESTSYAVAEMM